MRYRIKQLTLNTDKAALVSGNQVFKFNYHQDAEVHIAANMLLFNKVKTFHST